MKPSRPAALLVAPLLAAAGGIGVFLPATPATAPERSVAGTSPDSLVLEDDLGRTVRLAGPPARIVSLIPAATELLFALDAGSRVVGRTRFGTHPPAAAEVPSVGPGMAPSLEMVTSREPDLVVLYAGAANRATVDRLASLGIAAVALRHDTFDDLYRNVRRLGRITGRAAAARALEEGILCRLRTVASVTGEAPARRVYYEVWSDPPVTVGAGSYLDSLLTVAGARNVFGDLAAPSPRVGLESVVSRAPDLVVVPRRSGRDAAASPSRRPGWDALEAVRAGRVREVDGDLVHRLGPRIGEAAAALARAVHPELASRLAPGALEAACGSAPAGDTGSGRGSPEAGPRAGPVVVSSRERA